MTKKPTPTLDALLNRVQRKCAARYGLKSELARLLGVTPQCIRKWVDTRDNEPGGEVTLLMLKWVKAGEAKQTKTVAVLETPPRRKTRQLKSYHEKSKRVRKK